MATITKGRTFTSGETVTPAKLNDVVDLATVTNIQTADIADGQVTTAKILDANVTNAKLASDIDASKLTAGTLPIARIADAAVTPTKLSQPLTLATAQNTNGNTSINFTGIPSWAKRVSIILSRVSTNGTSPVQIRIGSGSIETSGYVNGGAGGATGVSAYTTTAGFRIETSASATTTRCGVFVLALLEGNVWVFSGSQTDIISGVFSVSSGDIGLSGTLDRVSLTTVNGTDTFDAGSVNIMYEG